jgi:uncharacterized membrane protein
MRWSRSKTGDKISLKKRYQLWKLRARKIWKKRREEDTTWWIFIKFIIAPIITVIGILVLYLLFDFDTFLTIGSAMFIYFVPPAGKETVIPTAVLEYNIDPVTIALSIAFIDFVTALFLVWNYDFVKLIPYLGKWMDKIEKKNKNKLNDHPWWEKFVFIGVVLFVIFPFQGSGGVGGSILGRVVGLGKYKVLSAITIGAVFGCLLIAYLTDAITQYFENKWYQLLILLIVAAVLLGVYNLYIRMKNNKNG